jgi:hypothetical protein
VIYCPEYAEREFGERETSLLTRWVRLLIRRMNA